MNKIIKILSEIRKSSYKSQIQIYNYAESEAICPTCKTICKIDQYDIRTPQEINLFEKYYLFVLIGIYRCPNCKKNDLKYCFRSQPDILQPRRRYTNQAMEKVKIKVTGDLQSYFSSAKSARRDYHLSVVPSTSWRWINNAEIEKNNSLDESKLCGIICIDEFYPSGECVVSVVDDKSSQVIVQEELKNCTKEEIIRLLKKAKNKLSDVNVDVNQVNTDGSKLYKNSVDEVFGVGKHQRCTFHISKDVGKQYIRAIRLNNVFEMPIGSRSKGFQVKVRYMILKSEWELIELQFWDKVLELNPKLKPYQDIWYMFTNIWDTNNYDTGRLRWKNLLKLLETGIYPKECEVIKKCLLDEDTMERSLTYARLGTDSKTSNTVERVHRKYRKIEKIHYGLRSAKTRLRRYTMQ